MKIPIKKILIFVILIVGVFTSNCFANDIEVLMDGEKIVFDTAPILEEGRTLVPFRKIFEILGYKVSWDGDERKVNATKKGKEIKLIIDNKDITVNDEKILSDVAPKIINSRTYVPIRIVSEYSDCDVLWDEKTKTVLIYSKNEEYDQGITSSDEQLITDGKYIYYSGYDENVYKFTNELKVEKIPFNAEDSLSIYKNKLYGKVEQENYKYHLQTFDMKTSKTKEIFDENISSCAIYDNKIYYSIYILPQNDINKKSGLYVMDLDGKNKKQLFYGVDYLEKFYITDDYIFLGNKIYSIQTGELKTLVNYYITATDIDEANYYMAIGIYNNKDYSVFPIGICSYNYRTFEYKYYFIEKEIKDIEVTSNSVFLTWKDDEKYPKNMGNNYHIWTEPYFIVRLTKNFEHPVEIYKGDIYTQGYNKELSWYCGVAEDIDVIGNYIYFDHKSFWDGPIKCISTDGKNKINLYNFFEYTMNSENESDYRYDIADFTKEMRS